MPKKDGGPAFPLSVMHNGVPVRSTTGMSLRDWFAGQALAGILTNDSLMTACENVPGVAREAFTMADAMLEARGE